MKYKINIILYVHQLLILSPEIGKKRFMHIDFGEYYFTMTKKDEKELNYFRVQLFISIKYNPNPYKFSILSKFQLMRNISTNFFKNLFPILFNMRRTPLLLIFFCFKLLSGVNNLFLVHIKNQKITIYGYVVFPSRCIVGKNLRERNI